MELYLSWLAFAHGDAAIGGKKLIRPTGKLASAIRMEETVGGEDSNLYHVAIIADEEIAPEALYLEKGHRAVDLKQHLEEGRTYPIHRGGSLSWSPQEGGSYRHPALGISASSSHPGQYLVAYARVGKTGWVIPAMPAYETGLHLAREAARKLSGQLVQH